MKALVYTGPQSLEFVDMPDPERMTVIICKCESGNSGVPVISMGSVVIRDRFMRTVEARNA